MPEPDQIRLDLSRVDIIVVVCWEGQDHPGTDVLRRMEEVGTLLRHAFSQYNLGINLLQVVFEVEGTVIVFPALVI